MLKETLHFIITLTTTIIVLLIVVILLQLSITGMINTSDDDIYTDSMSVSGIANLKNGMLLLTGNDGRDGFFKIYNRKSELIDEGTFTYVGTDIYIQGISATSEGFNLICKAVGSTGSYGLVYTYNLAKKELNLYELPYLPQDEDYTYFASGAKFYAAGQKFIYDIDPISRTYETIRLSNVYKVHDIYYNDEKIYVVGQKALNSALIEGTFAFYSIFDENGEMVWEYSTMKDYKSVLTRVLADRNGNLVLLGEYSEKDGYKFTKDFAPNIPKSNEDRLSSFILCTDSEGKVVASNVYNYNDGLYIYDITGITSNSRIITSGFYIDDPAGSSYICNINIINKELSHMQSYEFSSRTDALYYLATNEDEGIFTCMNIYGTNAYRIKYHSAVPNLISEIKLINALRNSVIYLKGHVKAFFYTFICLITCFILKTKYYWRKTK